MPAPKKNTFWKLRSTHGREKIFATPEILLAAAEEYFHHTSKRKWIKIEYKTVGPTLKKVKIPTDTPFTIAGLCIFLGVNSSYFRQFKKNNKDHEGFSSVIAHIEDIMDAQKFEGAAVGAFNANIISRDLGLKEQTENKTIMVIPEITSEMRKKFKEDFDSQY